MRRLPGLDAAPGRLADLDPGAQVARPDVRPHARDHHAAALDLLRDRPGAALRGVARSGVAEALPGEHRDRAERGAELVGGAGRERAERLEAGRLLRAPAQRRVLGRALVERAADLQEDVGDERRAQHEGEEHPVEVGGERAVLRVARAARAGGEREERREEAGRERREREGRPRRQERRGEGDVHEEEGAERVARAARRGEDPGDRDEIERHDAGDEGRLRAPPERTRRSRARLSPAASARMGTAMAYRTW